MATTLTFTASTPTYTLNSDGYIDGAAKHHPTSGTYTVVSQVVPIDPVHKTGGSFWLLQTGPQTDELVSVWAAGITIVADTLSGGTHTLGASHIDPLADWRILIKAMAGGDGTVGKNYLTFNATTKLWTRDASGKIAYASDISHGYHADASGPFWVNPVMVPYDPSHATGTSFWELKEGPNKGYLVSTWTNTLPTYGDVTVAQNANFNRGPGETLATIYRPAAHSAGASINYNAPGELHFTLLVDDPNIRVPIPKQTHYAVEFWNKDTSAWDEVFAGLMWDLDATETECVFYGIDYLALFRLVVDERFTASKPYEPAPVGSFYAYKSIKYIIEHELDYAIAKENSPVGFIVRGDVSSAMDVTRTIKGFYSTFRQTLEMVVGLINSHRDGSGIQTRISVKKIDGVYTVMVEEDPGMELDNLTLEYRPGGLIQGYRIIPFGPAWASRVDLIGRQKDGLKVDYRAESSAVPQTLWGAINQAPVLVETEDHFDLLRRARQAAADAGALGRQISVGLKLGSLRPLEAFDICDMVPVIIKHGAIDTSDWSAGAFDDTTMTHLSSGYWAINGVTWESFDDGHWLTGLGLYPRNQLPKSLIDCTFDSAVLSPSGNSGLDIFGNWLTSSEYGVIITEHLAGFNGGTPLTGPSTGTFEWVTNDTVLNATGDGPIIDALSIGAGRTNPNGGTQANSGYAWGPGAFATWWPDVVNSGYDGRWVWDITAKKVSGICTIFAPGSGGGYPTSVEASDDGVHWHTVFTTGAIDAALVGGTNAVLSVPPDDQAHNFWALRLGPKYYLRSGASYDAGWDSGYSFMMWEAIISTDVRA
jgi:hypothetical protein